MRVKYFADTDTALVEFADGPAVETRELDENLYVDLDADGHVVSLTVEHVQRSAGMEEFSYQRVTAAAGAPMLAPARTSGVDSPGHASPYDKRVQPGGPHWGTRPRPLPPRLPAAPPPSGGCVRHPRPHGHLSDQLWIHRS